MKLLYGLTDDQMFDVYSAVWEQFHHDDIVNRIYENNYRQNENITDEEIQEATEYLKEICASYCDYASAAEAAIDYVLAKRPPKEEPEQQKAPDVYYAKVLEMYGLTDGDAFRIKGHPHIYHFDEGDLLYSKHLDDETSERSTYTLAQFLFAFKKEDIELISKHQPPDLLGETLKRIGLETNQHFNVDDPEWKGFEFYVDSFGDLYVVSGDTNEFANHDFQPEYFTLGRILTQYPDKVVPM